MSLDEPSPRRYAPAVALIIQAVVAAGIGYNVLLSQLSIAACDGRRCDFTLIYGSGVLYFIAAGLLFLASMVAVIRIGLANRRRDASDRVGSSWIPYLGAALTLLVWLVSFSMLQQGLGGRF
jgi:ABC-type Na+ efflux pump permease subunit